MEHKRTWIYCRVAYPDARALASQQAALEAFAEKQGFEIAGTTAEQASGLDFSRRGLTEVSKNLFSIYLTFLGCAIIVEEEGAERDEKKLSERHQPGTI